MKPGRNDPCPCGSGKKYKQCHALKANKPTPWTRIGLALVAAALLLGGARFVWGLINETPTNTGRVWSAEHGHWHNADGTEAGASAPAAPAP